MPSQVRLVETKKGGNRSKNLDRDLFHSFNVPTPPLYLQGVSKILPPASFIFPSNTNYMDLVLLPGSGLHNKEWVEKVEASLSPLFGQTKIQYYKHWTEGGYIETDYELKALERNVKGLKGYVVFGKSVGTMLALNAISNNFIKPKKSIFLGMPLSGQKAEHSKIKTWINKSEIPLLFIQEEFDPYMTYQGLLDFLEECKPKNYIVAKIPGNSHDYLDIGAIKLLVEEFIK